MSFAGGLCLSSGPYALTFQIGSICGADWLLVRSENQAGNTPLALPLLPLSPAAAALLDLPAESAGVCYRRGVKAPRALTC